MRRPALALRVLGLVAAGVAATPATALALGSPLATTGPATSITTTTTTLTGTVNAAAQATTYQFDYGPTAVYSEHTPAQTLGALSLLSDVAVSASITGLAPATTYHFRLSASNASGSTQGVDHTFTTAGAPSAQTGPASAVSATSATLAGSVNPAGTPATYSFQYGTTTTYGQQTPGQPAGSGMVAGPVSATVAGLSPATTYHYRVTATNTAATAAGADRTFVTPGTAGPSTLAAIVNPAGGDTDLATALTIGSDPAGTPVGQVSTVAQAVSSEFANHLASFGVCPASNFENAQGPTAANCPDRSAILGVGTLVTEDQTGATATSDQGYIVKTAATGVAFWWHTPTAAGAAEAFGQLAGVVSQETGLYGPVVSYDFTSLPAGARVKRLALDYQRSSTTGRAPFVAATCPGGSWRFQARILYRGSVPSELPTTTTACGPSAGPPAPQPSKLQLSRATITGRVIDVLAPISRRASGNVSLELFAAGQRSRWRAPIDSLDGRIRDRHVLPASQASNGGTGILTIRYAGNAATRPQVVRLRAGSIPALLDATRPIIDPKTGHLAAHGTISSQARGVVRVQLEYYSGGQTTTLERFATIANGGWTLDSTLTAAQQNAIFSRRGPVESYILFTGYFARRMRGEMNAYQVLGPLAQD